MGAVKDRASAIIKRLEGESPTVAEIGVSKGALSALLRERTRHLFLIDKWSADVSASYRATNDAHALLSQDEHEANYAKARKIDAFICRMDSAEAAKTFDDAFFDMVFIDADHSYEGCKRDIISWLPKVKSGGWIGGHDYGDFGVTAAVDEVIGAVELDLNLTWFYRK